MMWMRGNTSLEASLGITDIFVPDLYIWYIRIVHDSILPKPNKYRKSKRPSSKIFSCIGRCNLVWVDPFVFKLSGA